MKTKEELFHSALKCMNFPTMKSLLKEEIDLCTITALIENTLEHDKHLKVFYTPLLLAANIGDINLVKYLIDNNAEINIKGKISTPLNNAISANNVPMVKLLLKNGAEVNSTEHYSTPLICAIVGINPIIMVNILLEFSVDVNQKSGCGIVPLISALRHNKYDIAKLLIEHGADIKAREKDDTAETLLTLWKEQKMLGFIRDEDKIAAKKSLVILSSQLPLTLIEHVKQTRKKSLYYHEPIEVTLQDYSYIVYKMKCEGINNTTTEFEKDGYHYTCMFDRVPDSEVCVAIHKLTNNYDNTIARFHCITSKYMYPQLTIKAKGYSHISKKEKLLDLYALNGPQKFKYGNFVLGSQVDTRDES